MQMSRVFVFRSRYHHDTEDVALAKLSTNEQAQRLRRIQAIRLRAPAPAIDLDARGVHHDILDAVGS